MAKYDGAVLSIAHRGVPSEAGPMAVFEGRTADGKMLVLEYSEAELAAATNLPAPVAAIMNRSAVLLSEAEREGLAHADDGKGGEPDAIPAGE